MHSHARKPKTKKDNNVTESHKRSSLFQRYTLIHSMYNFIVGMFCYWSTQRKQNYIMTIDIKNANIFNKMVKWPEWWPK